MKTQCSTPAAQASCRAFTLVEMLISIVMLALLILLVTQVVNTAATVVRPANKHIDTDTQARTVLDRMALDFGKMLKRTDVDYYLKATVIKYPGQSGGHKKGGGGPGGPGQTDLNDYIAFYSQVPGYSPGSPSPISLVAYRLNGLATVNGLPNPSYNKLDRLGKGLLWNGVSNADIPIVFLPLLIKDQWP